MVVRGSDLEALIDVLAGEAIGEGRQGMVAVAHVIRNRAVQNKSYWGGNSIYGVIHHPGQFECIGRPNPATPSQLAELRQWVPTVYDDTRDPTGGADHYHNPRKPGEMEKSKGWRANCDFIKSIGNHDFYRTKPQYR